MDNKINQCNSKNKGFSLKELLIVLALGGTCITVAANYYNKVQKQTLRKTEITATTDYAKAVSAFAHAYQVELYKNTYSGKVVTISPQKLVQYGYLKTVKKIKDPISGAQIYPCASIYFTQGKLQGMVYYRTDSPKLNGTDSQKLFLSEGLKSAGNDGGFISIDKNNNTFIQNNFTKFTIDAAQISTYFPKTGSATLLDDGLDSCQGAQLALPSYTSYMANVLGGINSELNPNNTVKQNVNEIVNDNPNNSISQLNMDATTIANKSMKTYAGQNKIIFQSNEDCQMNPNILSTMQDYNPDCPGPAGVCKLENVPFGVYTTGSCNLITDTYTNGRYQVAEGCGKLPFPNKFGCRNKQLSLGYSQMQVSNGTVIEGKVASTQKDVTVINGFDEVSNTYSASENGAKVTSLGKLRAQTAQATATVDYAQACDQTEIGGIAKQRDYQSGTDNLSKLYSINQSVMICQKNALCNNTTSGIAGYCWLPLMPITVKINFAQAEHILSYQTPSGFFIKDSENYADNNGAYILDYADNLSFINGSIEARKTSSDGGSMCRGEYNRGGLWQCTAATNGKLTSLSGSSMDAFKTVYIQSDNLNPGIKTTSNGWDVWQLSNIGNKSLNQSLFSLLFSSCTGDNGSSYGVCLQSPGNPSTPGTKAYNLSLSSKQYTNIGGLPKIANPKYTTYQSKWDTNGYSWGCGDSSQNKCDGWKFGWVAQSPNYLKSVTISNDTSIIEVNASYVPVPIPPDPSGNCNTIPQAIKDTAFREATATIQGQGTESFVYVPNSYNLSSAANGAYCTAKATAKYCPANGEIGCKFTLEYQMSNGYGIKWGGSYNGSGVSAFPNLPSGSVYTSTVWWASYPGRGEENHGPITVSDQTLADHVRLPIGRNAGTYSVYHTPGTCQAANACTNPVTLQVYSSDYPLQ